MKTSQAEIEELISENYAGDAAIFIAAAESFIESVVLTLDEFNRAFQAGDCLRLAAVAHRLKGDTSLFHRKDAPELFSNIDRAARKNRLASQAEVTLATEAMERVIDELKSALTKLR